MPDPITPSTIYEVEFFPVPPLPEDDSTLLLTNGGSVFTGWYDAKEKMWYDCTAAPVAGVKAWAHLPDPRGCMKYCYPEEK